MNEQEQFVLDQLDFEQDLRDIYCQRPLVQRVALFLGSAVCAYGSYEAIYEWPKHFNPQATPALALAASYAAVACIGKARQSILRELPEASFLRDSE